MGTDIQSNSFNLPVASSQFSALPPKAPKQGTGKAESAKTFVDKAVDAVKNQKPLHQAQVVSSSNSKVVISPEQAQSMVKQMKGKVSYQYSAPKVDVPEHLQQTMTKDELGKLKEACMKDYRAAKTLSNLPVR
ncbi:hypothetical protein [Estrella lausannensis]|uniref:Uncharacterized protein n=1 Tax=Estrella lausannensis TaxID=483423 RepID=A0A0H5DMT3_9BACT|nr:hypothetical protein [Estrella lausannensis]CRX37466.1 hypothetical protein ELAC_0104 [Estrella lausannensis]